MQENKQHPLYEGPKVIEPIGSIFWLLKKYRTVLTDEMVVDLTLMANYCYAQGEKLAYLNPRTEGS